VALESRAATEIALLLEAGRAGHVGAAAFVAGGGDDHDARARGVVGGDGVRGVEVPKSEPSDMLITSAPSLTAWLMASVTTSEEPSQPKTR